MISRGGEIHFPRLREAHAKGRSASRLALEVDRTAEDGDEPPDDVQAESGAAEVALNRCVGLLKGLEYDLGRF